MKIALVAGESSGDRLGAGLIRALRNLAPDATFEGVAGPAMVAAGCEQLEPAESLAVFGLIEPLAHIPRLLRLRKALFMRWQEAPPDVFVGIDAPDFNLGLEKKLRRSGIKTVHYVSPSIWAWRPGRIETVKLAADRVLCILPFEKSLYDEHGVDAVFVGHPRADEVPAVLDAHLARQKLQIDASEVVAILPGSRVGEVSRLGAAFAAAAGQLAAGRPGIRFVVPIATQKLRSMIARQVADAGLEDRVLLLDGDSETAMLAADVVLVASGTAVLEAALLGRPAVAAYRVAPIAWAIGKALRLLKLEYYTLPNLLTDSPLVPEFIQHGVKPDILARAVANLLDDPERRRFISSEFAKLRGKLALNADQRAAETVFELARS